MLRKASQTFKWLRPQVTLLQLLKHLQIWTLPTLASFIMTAPILLLSSCGQVPIKDEIWYGNKGVLGAVEFHTLTTDQRKVTFEDWMKLIRTQALVCTSVNTFGDVKTSFEKLCSVCNCCSYDTQAAVEEFFNNIQKAEGK